MRVEGKSWSNDAAYAAAIIVGVLGLAVWAGWLLDVSALKSVAPGLATMKVSTALCFVLSACALASSVGAGAQRRVLIRSLSLILLVAWSGLTLVEYALQREFGLAHLFVPGQGAEVAGRMSLATAAAFLLFASALAVARVREGWASLAFVALPLAGLAVAFSALIGYLFGLSLLYRPLPESAMALHAAFGLLVLFIGTAALRPEIGWISLLRAQSSVGVFARRVFPAVVLAPSIIGWLILQGVEARWFDARDALALLSLACVVALTGLVWAWGEFADRLGEKLAVRDEVLRTVIETALDGFVLMDEGGRILDWNAEAERIFGWTREEAIGRLAGEMIVPMRDRAAHAAGLERFIKAGESRVLRRRLEVKALRRDGSEFPAELMILPARQAGHWVFSAFVHDLSSAKQAEAQLRQAQKMEAVGQLTGGVAHDFNNLLTVIIVSLDNVRSHLSGELQVQANNALRAAERGAALIRDLLAFSRKQPLSPEPLDLNRAIASVIEFLRRLLGERIEVELKQAPDLWPAFADASQVETAILNLAVNARDAMADGGKLAIETANVTLDAAYAARNGDVTPGDYVVISVSDSGDGMSAQVLERVFEPFFTTKPAGKGSGLGLSMVYGFAKQSRGHLSIYSEVGHGTTVRLYLPRAGAQGSWPVREAGDETAPRGRSGETVLVVEDDPQVRGVVVAQVRKLGYTALEAADASAAAEILRSDARIDLLFTDVVMPGPMTGRQLADTALARRPDLKILFTSGYTENSIVHHGRLDANVHFLAKPYRAGDLARKLREVLDAEPGPHPAGA
jgi:PAS domain S-box-containing protein